MNIVKYNESHLLITSIHLILVLSYRCNNEDELTV